VLAAKIYVAAATSNVNIEMTRESEDTLIVDQHLFCKSP
tara:strand:- start:1 stop:117 length:117 start_codon:yes stop_codon:yes gene_type:complete